MNGPITPSRRPAERMQVLLIEDEAEYAGLVADMLHAAAASTDGAGTQFEIRHATTLEDGLRAMQSRRPDVVLLDLLLPDSTGFGTFQRVQDLDRNVPIVIVSGHEDEELALQTVRAGAEDYLVKSKIHGQVLARVLTYAAHRHAGRPPVEDDRGKLREIIERSADGIVIVNRDGIVRFVNPAAERLFGRTFDELVGEPFGFPVLVGEKEEVDIFRRGGEVRVAELRVADLSWEGETAFLTTLRDVTERKQLEEHLRHSQKMEGIGRLAGGVAHDFNNLLTSILGFAQLLEMDMAPDDPHQAEVQEIVKAAERAAGITKQLLAFSRRGPSQVATLNLNECVFSMNRLFTQTLGPHIELDLKLDDALWPVDADPTQMEQIIMNLVLNAKDAMFGEGRLEIQTQNMDKPGLVDVPGLKSATGPCVLLRVRDDGCGIPDAVVDRIFDPYFTTKERGKGTGLGLSIVYGIVKQMGGALEVESMPGEGTEFRIFIPACREAQPAAPRKELLEVKGGTETILLVEDEDGVREMVSRVLRQLGYRVLEARHGGAALDIAAMVEDPIDLVLSDVVMPNMDGPQMVERLSETRSGFKTLFMSGFTQGRLESHGVDLNRYRLLSKPYSLDKLAAEVRAVLDEPAPGEDEPASPPNA